jgi:hypothetical protein
MTLDRLKATGTSRFDFTARHTTTCCFKDLGLYSRCWQDMIFNIQNARIDDAGPLYGRLPYMNIGISGMSRPFQYMASHPISSIFTTTSCPAERVQCRQFQGLAVEFASSK